mmetsp:Transcript_15994/g.42376  ORF Transcript_15994/g.42376 Transcript_15994/m.42376 type:complete len:344 (-) Transcript_15994:374-1405(-)
MQADLQAVFLLCAREEAYFRANLAGLAAQVAACIEANDQDAAAILRVTFDDGRRFVVKIIDTDEPLSPPTMLEMLARSPGGWPANVVRYHAVFDGPEYRLVLMDECIAGDLNMESGLESSFSEDGLRCVARGSLRGLNALHERRLVHCDIKSGNLLCAESNLEAYYAATIRAELQEKLSASIMLVDLSEAHEFGKPRGDCGSTRAPEVWREVCEHIRHGGHAWTAAELEETDAFEALCPATPAEDSWALGVTLFELAHNEDLHDPDTVLDFVAKGDYDGLCSYYAERNSEVPTIFRDRGLSEAAVHFVQKLLVTNPLERATPKVALEDSWLALPGPAPPPAAS